MPLKTKPCPKCKTNKIPVTHRLCKSCKKHNRSNSPSRQIRFQAQRVVSRIIVNGTYPHRQPNLFVCTEDILNLRGIHGYNADPDTFRQASDLADMYNAYYARAYAPNAS